MKLSLTLVLLLVSFSSLAQDFANFLSGGDLPWTTLELENYWSPKKDVDNGPEKTDVIFRRIIATQQIHKGEKHALGITGRYEKLDLNQDKGILRDYYNIQFGTNFVYNLPDNKFWSLSTSYGSSSDKPFKNGRDGVAGANFVYKINPRWFLLANYSNNRPFLNGVPLPGVFYVKEMSRERTFIIGFPMIIWRAPISESFSVSAFALLPWTYKLRLNYNYRPFLRPYIGYEQLPQNYFRHDREKRFDRFFWTEQRAGLGIEGNVSKNLRYDVGGGWAFDRKFFEARNFSDKKKFLYNLENGIYTAVNLRFSF